MSKMTQNVISTTADGEEQYEECTIGKTPYVQYDYRTPDGKLFSRVKKTLDACRIARDKWLKKLST